MTSPPRVLTACADARAAEPEAAAPTPLWFGDAGREAFGWWHPPHGAPRGAVVLVAPFGFEALCAHRALRAFARTLAASGLGVLRYDHPGTGDSAGDDAAAPVDDDGTGWVSRWREGVDRAVDLAAARSPGAPLAVVGFRLGATLAAAALARRSDVARLVLVAPCATGRGFARELRARHATLGLATSSNEALGFALAPSTLAGLEGLELRTCAPPIGSRVLVIERDDAPADRSAELLASGGAAVETSRLPGFAAMMRDPHRTEIPELMIAGVRQWLERELPAVTASARKPPRRPERAVSVAASACEEPLPFGAERFAILTMPVEPIASRRTAVVLLNAGATHHVGPGRAWVRWARAWAARGFPALRLDLGGLGDSAGDDNHPYPPHALDDVSAALQVLRTRTGVDRFVLVGLCSGACHAFAAALVRPDVVGAFLLNPVTLHFTPGMSLDVRGVAAFKHTTRYKRALLRPRAWAKLLRGGVDRRSAARAVRAVIERARDVVGARVAALTRAWRRGPGGDADVPRELGALVGRDVDLVFVFSDDEPGLDRLARHGGRTWRRLLRRGLVRLERVPGADHTLTPVAAQRHVESVLTERLLARHGCDG